MDDQIKQIAERLRGLRDVLELTAEDIARDCEISAEEYRLAETGDYDISVSMLQKIARKYGIALDALMFGEEPKMSSFELKYRLSPSFNIKSFPSILIIMRPSSTRLNSCPL